MNMSQLVERTIRAAMKQMRVSMPARVESYDPARQMVQVSIIQPELDDDGTTIPQSVIADVPVSFMRCGGAHLTFPINRGDTGLLVFSDRDIGAWVSEDFTGKPDSDRMHAMSDAVFIPGIQGGGVSANGNDVELQYQGSTIHIRQSGQVEVNATDVVVNATQTTINSTTDNNGNVTITGNLEVTGNTTTTGLTTTGGLASMGTVGGPATIAGGVSVSGGDVVADGISLKNHTHTDSMGGQTSGAQ